MAESFGWLYGQQLKDRWDMNDAEITDLIFNYGLLPYDDETMLPIEIAEEKEYMMSPDPFGAKDLVPTLKDRINTCLFRLNDVESFERKHPELMKQVPTNDTKRDESFGLQDVVRDKKERKLRPNQKHKLKAQKMAKTVWENDPTKTITAIAKDFEHSSESLFDGRKYKYRTIYNWIQPYALNHSPGRKAKI